LAVATAAACSFNHALAADGETLQLEAQTVVGSTDSAQPDSYKAAPSSAATKLELTHGRPRSRSPPSPAPRSMTSSSTASTTC